MKPETEQGKKGREFQSVETHKIITDEREKRKQSDLEWTTTVADMSSLHDDDRLYAAQTIQQLRERLKKYEGNTTDAG